MKTIKKVQIKPVMVTYIPDKNDMIQDDIYISFEYSTSSHLCLCGCGELVVTPLNSKWINDGWSFLIDKKGLSVSPSIGNFQIPCKSHYVITDNIANILKR